MISEAIENSDNKHSIHLSQLKRNRILKLRKSNIILQQFYDKLLLRDEIIFMSRLQLSYDDNILLRQDLNEMITTLLHDNKYFFDIYFKIDPAMTFITTDKRLLHCLFFHYFSMIIYPLCRRFHHPGINHHHPLYMQEIIIEIFPYDIKKNLLFTEIRLMIIRIYDKRQYGDRNGDVNDFQYDHYHMIHDNYIDTIEKGLKTYINDHCYYEYDPHLNRITFTVPYIFNSKTLKSKNISEHLNDFMKVKPLFSQTDTLNSMDSNKPLLLDDSLVPVINNSIGMDMIHSNFKSNDGHVSNQHRCKILFLTDKFDEDINDLYVTFGVHGWCCDYLMELQLLQEIKKLLQMDCIFIIENSIVSDGKSVSTHYDMITKLRIIGCRCVIAGLVETTKGRNSTNHRLFDYDMYIEKPIHGQKLDLLLSQCLKRKVELLFR
jgi:hypothetical protein